MIRSFNNLEKMSYDLSPRPCYIQAYEMSRCCMPKALSYCLFDNKRNQGLCMDRVSFGLSKLSCVTKDGGGRSKSCSEHEQ